MFGLNRYEKSLYKKLKNPYLIQDYLNTLKYNFEKKGETCRSPRYVLESKSAHCIEGALLAASILWYHGHKPLLLDLRSKKNDYDHVVALFQKNGFWGAISKTNHNVLRFRDPIYKNIRELALSYFHEYFLNSGEKTMRDYSVPFDLTKYGYDWITNNDDLWDLGADLDDSKHIKILPPKLKKLRKADPIEIKAGKIFQSKK